MKWVTAVIAGLVALMIAGHAGAQRGPLDVTTRALRIGEVAVAYSATVTASGGTRERSWSIAQGELPPGLTLVEPIGVIAGTPSRPGTFSFQIQVTDREGRTDTQMLTIPVAAPVTIDTPSLPHGTATETYSQALTVFGGVAPYSWSVTDGALPAGLALDEARGTISGTPAVTGSSTFLVAVHDGVGGSTTLRLSIKIDPPGTVHERRRALEVASTSPPSATAGVAYAYRIRAAGGEAPYAWQVVAGQLPAGLAFDRTTAVLAGTPASPDVGTVVLLVRDAAGAEATRALSLTVEAGHRSDLTAWVDAVCAADTGKRPAIAALCALRAGGTLTATLARTVGQTILVLARS